MRRTKVSFINGFLAALLLTGGGVATVNAQPVSESFTDDFSDNSADWSLYEDEIASATIKGGTLNIRFVQGGYIDQTLVPFEVGTAFEFEVQCVTSPSGDFGYGISFEANAEITDGYYFSILPSTQTYSVFQKANDEWITEPVAVGNSSLIKAKGTNTIGMIRQGDQVELTINGTNVEVLFIEDTPHNDIGLYSETYEDSVMPVTFAYDNVVVTPLAEVERPSAPLPGTPTALQNWQETPKDIVAELSTLDLVASEGRLLFEEDYAFQSGNGSWYYPLAGSSSVQDVVIGLDLTYTKGTGESFEACGFMGRVVEVNRTAVSAVNFAVDSDGNFALFENLDNELTDVDVVSTGSQTEESVSMLLVLRGPTGALYINGERTLELNNLAPNAGSFAIFLYGNSSSSRCEARDIWVYQFDD